MKDFLMAALPWLLLGAPLALLAANWRDSWGRDEVRRQRWVIWCGAGLLVGVVTCMVFVPGQLAMGLCLGPLWGMAIGAVWERSRRQGSVKRHE